MRSLRAPVSRSVVTARLPGRLDAPVSMSATAIDAGAARGGKATRHPPDPDGSFAVPRTPRLHSWQLRRTRAREDLRVRRRGLDWLHRGQRLHVVDSGSNRRCVRGYGASSTTNSKTAAAAAAATQSQSVGVAARAGPERGRASRPAARRRASFARPTSIATVELLFVCSHSCSNPTAASLCFSTRLASEMRHFTVPTGMPSIAAIWS